MPPCLRERKPAASDKVDKVTDKARDKVGGLGIIRRIKDRADGLEYATITRISADITENHKNRNFRAMLKNQPWLRTESDLFIEWLQARDEGREVEHLREACFKVSDQAREGDRSVDTLAEELRLALLAAPVRADFPYVEPDELEAIQAERPPRRHDFSEARAALTRESYRPRLEGAWGGRLAGRLLGNPVEGWLTSRLVPMLKETDNYPLRRYMAWKDFSKDMIERYKILAEACWVDTLHGTLIADDDSNYTVLAMMIMERYGPGFTSDDVADAWVSWMPLLCACTAERVAYRNIAQGMLPPETATWRNPYREWIGAQIRGDFFGYVRPGDPEAAAALAWRDARVSHIKNGIYGEMFVAATLAAAAVEDDPVTILEAGLDEIPAKCRLREDVSHVLEWYREGITGEEAIGRVHKRYDESSRHDWCLATSNAMLVAVAVLFAGGDFGRAIGLGVQAGFDTDCNGATAGSIMGMLVGRDGIPAQWLEPFGGTVMTSFRAWTTITMEQFLEHTLKLALP